ncbi:MAG: hypothetical protein AAGB12_11925 [Pseudomonadota bacterium]
MLSNKPQENDEERIIWTPNMPDRRKIDRRSGWDRRECQGKPINIPDVDIRNGKDRRKSDRRQSITLTITGRAMDA